MNDHYIDALAYSLAIQIAPKITKRRRKPSLRKIRRERKKIRRTIRFKQRYKKFVLFAEEIVRDINLYPWQSEVIKMMEFKL